MYIEWESWRQTLYHPNGKVQENVLVVRGTTTRTDGSLIQYASPVFDEDSIEDEKELILRALKAELGIPTE